MMDISTIGQVNCSIVDQATKQPIVRDTNIRLPRGLVEKPWLVHSPLSNKIAWSQTYTRSNWSFVAMTQANNKGHCPVVAGDICKLSFALDELDFRNFANYLA
jgi:hypothetical protein